MMTRCFLIKNKIFSHKKTIYLLQKFLLLHKFYNKILRTKRVCMYYMYVQTHMKKKF